MRTHTVRGPLDGSDYRGKTAPGGFVVLRGGAAAPACRNCGSQLGASREWRCPCRTRAEVVRRAA